MKGRSKGDSTGVVAKNTAPSDVYAGAGSPTAKAAMDRKGGFKKGGKTVGKVAGDKAMMSAARMPRKSGGRAGSDCSPMSSASKGTAPSGRGA